MTLTRYDSRGGRDAAPRDLARLVVDEPDFIQWLRNTRPELFKRDVHKGVWLRVGIWGAGALAAILLMLFVILPGMADTLSRVIPIEREVAFGQAVTRQMISALEDSETDLQACTSAEGRASLDTLLERLTAGRALEYEIDIRVFNHSMVNAFAAPGGQVIVMEGLLESAATPEEVAGGLAHEIGHVEHRDPTRHALRSIGSAGLLFMVFGDYSGIALLGEHMLSASYSRDAEARADRFALEMLSAANVDVAGFEHFFAQRTAEDSSESAVPGVLSTHPGVEQRASRASRVAAHQGETRKVLTPSEWQALQAMCEEGAEALE
ncbi:M48 family metallopeptidase [Halomonas sabkhae]|uniref:M48 family metallopeptidase n=1 Tax=Halomonas sabkhae TaxID=626223 RepID=UPI0025B2CCC5|nr:M48 family metallopeptidase [Halomonas sabkhae]MDN3523984.1 M48 family metallopeptidase [Halomonas sabkhae]